VVSSPFGELNSFNVKRLLMTWLSRCSVRQVMSGSQPAAVGELHPLHRKALRHPLILDGLFSASAPCPTPPFGFVAPSALARELCLHVLSSFQRTGWSYRRDPAPEARSRARDPSGVSPLGEPYNLTSAFQLVSTPRRYFLSFFDVATAFQRNGARRRTAWGLCEPEGLLEDPATGRVTLGSTNIRGPFQSVNPCVHAGRTFTTC